MFTNIDLQMDCSSSISSMSSPMETTKKGKSKGTKSTYKHIPHSEKPVHLVARRNARERRRVQAVNSAFANLRKCVPITNRNKRLSKVKTLQKAIEYIEDLTAVLHGEKLDHELGPNPMVEIMAMMSADLDSSSAGSLSSPCSSSSLISSASASCSSLTQASPPTTSDRTPSLLSLTGTRISNHVSSPSPSSPKAPSTPFHSLPSPPSTYFVSQPPCSQNHPSSPCSPSSSTMPMAVKVNHYTSNKETSSDPDFDYWYQTNQTQGSTPYPQVPMNPPSSTSPFPYGSYTYQQPHTPSYYTNQPYY